MTTTGIEAVYLETHNWGKSVKFFQSLGYELEFATDHASGLLRSAQGPYLFVAEVPAGEPTGMQAVLKVPAEDSVPADGTVDVVSPFEDTHFGTREMTVRDPDGRHWILQAPAGQA